MVGEPDVASGASPFRFHPPRGWQFPPHTGVLGLPDGEGEPEVSYLGIAATGGVFSSSVAKWVRAGHATGQRWERFGVTRHQT